MVVFKICRCIADDKLKPGNRFEYDYGIKYKFNSSIKTIFTQGLQKVYYNILFNLYFIYIL